MLPQVPQTVRVGVAKRMLAALRDLVLDFDFLCLGTAIFKPLPLQIYFCENNENHQLCQQLLVVLGGRQFLF